jgi:TolB-like protein
MIHRLIFLTLIQFSLLLSQTQIAVVDFEALGVSSNDARALTNRLMIEMHRTNKFKVLEREMLDKVIEEQKFQLSGCNADQCLVELGQIANVQQIVGGTISKVGEVFTITARLISVESGEVVESALYDYEGKIGALMKNGMANIASQLASIPILPTMRTEISIPPPEVSSLSSLGLKVSKLTSELKRKYGQTIVASGLIITSIQKNSSAYREGIRTGYVIEKMGPDVRYLSRVTSLAEFDEIMKEYYSGDTIVLLVRKDYDRTFTVTITVR